MAGMLLRLTNSNASSPLPPAMSRTPDPDAKRSLPYVSSRNLFQCQANLLLFDIFYKQQVE